MSEARIRWWPAVLIVVVMVGLLAYIWLAPMSSDQQRVLPTFPTVFFGTVLLVAWAAFFSRLPKPTRRRILFATIAVVSVALLTLRIEGVDGNLVPVLGFRWSTAPDFEAGAAASVREVRPGANDYPQFYGPRRDATLDGPRLAHDWTSHPPEEVWRREVGEGWSSFAVVGSAAVTQEQRGDQEVVVRYERDTGSQIWVHADTAPFNTTVGGRGPRATPTIHGGRVYSLGATGILNCLDLRDGEAIWSTNVLQEHNLPVPEWGMPFSPLVVGDLVVVQLGLYGSSLVAYDLETGQAVWQAGSDRGSYSTPALLEIGGRPQILIVNARTVVAHDPETGEVLWRQAWDLPGERVTPPLRLAEDSVLVSAGYGVGSRRLSIRSEDDGFEVSEVWESRRLKSKFAPMILHRGAVFGLDDGVMVALDPATGERIWKRGRYGHGQMILVGDVLLVQAENGDVVLVAADPEEHRELARIEALSGKTWNPPALSGDLLLVRNNREAAAYRLPLAR